MKYVLISLYFCLSFASLFCSAHEPYPQPMTEERIIDALNRVHDIATTFVPIRPDSPELSEQKIPRNESDNSQSTQEEDDELCDIALSSYFEASETATCLKPHVLALIQSRREIIPILKRIKSGELSPKSQHTLYIHTLLLEASGKAIEEKESKLKQYAQDLAKREIQLQKKISKKTSAFLTAGITFLGTIGGVIVTYFSSH